MKQDHGTGEGGAATSALGARHQEERLPVTVVIPAYNRADLVVRAVSSALNQRPFPPAQVIVVDDCSTDGTAEAAARAGAEVVRHERNQGEGAARNTGVAHARESWIALLDSDDEWLPHMLATVWPARADHVLVGGAYLKCADGGDDGAYAYAGPLGPREQLLRSPADIVFPENYVAASGTMVRRDIVRDVGGYDPGLKGGADFDLWLRVLEQGTGRVVDEPVVRYYLHAGQVTQDQQMMRDFHEMVVLRYSGRAWWRQERFEAWQGGALYDATKSYIKQRELRAAVRGGRTLLSSPTRAAGAARTTIRRRRLVRRTWRTDAWGRPRAVIVGDGNPARVPSRDSLNYSVVRARSPLRAALRLLARPPAVIVTRHRSLATLARAVGVRPVSDRPS